MHIEYALKLFSTTHILVVNSEGKKIKKKKLKAILLILTYGILIKLQIKICRLNYNKIKQFYRTFITKVLTKCQSFSN